MYVLLCSMSTPLKSLTRPREEKGSTGSFSRRRLRPITPQMSLAVDSSLQAIAKSSTYLSRKTSLPLQMVLQIVRSCVVVLKSSSLEKRMLLICFSQSLPDSRWPCSALNTGRTRAWSIHLPNLNLYQSEYWSSIVTKVGTLGAEEWANASLASPP